MGTLNRYELSYYQPAGFPGSFDTARCGLVAHSDRTATSPGLALPTFEEAIDLICRCEHGDVEVGGESVGSWLEYCDARGIFHYPTTEYVTGLAEAIGALGAGRMIEVAAGKGRLARALQALGIGVVPTDPEASEAGVEVLDAGEALAKYQPELVVGSWVPIDSAIDGAVMNFPSVRWYVYLGHEHNGVVGHEALWRAEGWEWRRLKALDEKNLGRNDVCLGFEEKRILQHGWTVLFERRMRSQRLSVTEEARPVRSS